MSANAAQAPLTDVTPAQAPKKAPRRRPRRKPAGPPKEDPHTQQPGTLKAKGKQNAPKANPGTQSNKERKDQPQQGTNEGVTPDTVPASATSSAASAEQLIPAEAPAIAAEPQVIAIRAKKNGKKSKDTWMMDNVGDLIVQFDPADLEPDETEVSSADGFDVICTYNWADSKSPIIYVPGGPPIWTPRQLPASIPPNRGLHFIDEHGFRFPDFPYEPLFRALSHFRPNTQFDDVDVLLNRSSMRQLLDFAAGRNVGQLRLDINIVNNTLIVRRKMRTTCEWSKGQNSAQAGYGHNFERYFTRPQPKVGITSGHHRAIRYNLGSLNCVVMFEADACVGDDVRPKGRPPQRSGAAAATSTTIYPNGSNSIWTKDLAVMTVGQPTDPTAVAELKSVGKPLAFTASFMQQLWLGRTTHLIIGTHENGTFNRTERRDVGDRFADWEVKHQDELRKLTRLLHMLRVIVVAQRAATAVSSYVALTGDENAPRALSIFATLTPKPALPADVIAKYWSAAEP